MHVIGTGLSGLVGSRFTHLYQDAYHFENLDLSTNIDITDTESVLQAVKKSQAETIIHLAAFTDVSLAHQQKNQKSGSCYQVNVVGTKNIALAAQESGKYLIHISTDYIFDGNKETPYQETDSPHPIEWYGQTKYLAEKTINQHLDPKQFVILRLAYPYQESPARPDWLARMRAHLQANTLPPAFTNHTITPTYTDDFAAVIDYCLKNRPHGIYHAVGSSWHTDHQIATIVKKIFNLPGDVQKGDLESYIKKVDRPYQRTMKVSNEKLKRDFGLEMKTLEEGLRVIATM